MSFAVHDDSAKVEQQRFRVLVGGNGQLIMACPGLEAGCGREVALGLGRGVVLRRFSFPFFQSVPCLALCRRLLALQVQAFWALTRPGIAPPLHSFHWPTEAHGRAQWRVGRYLRRGRGYPASRGG